MPKPLDAPELLQPLERIAEALERLSPPPTTPAYLASHPVYVHRDGALTPARNFAPLPLELLRGVETQKAALLANLRRHAAGHAAHDVLLWGARGTGKSALVKSCVATVQAERGALALVEMASSPQGLPQLFERLANSSRAFAVFLDDFGFDSPGEARALRSILEGGAEARPGNVRLMVTSNRRHLVPRDIAEQASAINPRDVVDDSLALADRFGLSLGFHALDQAGYLAIVAGYAAHYRLGFDAPEALAWSATRGARSGRVAWHYVVDLAGRAGLRV